MHLVLQNSITTNSSLSCTPTFEEIFVRILKELIPKLFNKLQQSCINLGAKIIFYTTVP